MSKPKEKTAHTTVQHLNRQQIRLYRESSELVTTTLFDLDSHGRFRQATTTARQDDKKHADKVEYIITKEDGRNRPLKEQVIYGDGATQIIRYRYFGLDHHGNPSRRYKEIWGHFGPGKGPPTQLINRELAVYSYTYFNTAANTEVQ